MSKPKGGISYIPWCIASYYIIKLPHVILSVLISFTGTRQLNNGGKRLVLPIKPSVPLLCRSIYDFRSTIPNISLVKSKRVFDRRLLVNYCKPYDRNKLAIEEGLCFSTSCINVRWWIYKRFPRTCLEISTYSRCEISLRCLFVIAVLILSLQ